MSKRSQSNRSIFRKLCIGVELGHGLGLVLLGDRPIDFGGLGFVVAPGVGEIGGGQAGIVVEEFGFAQAHAEVADEQPDGNAGVADAGCSAHDAGGFVDAAPGGVEAVGQEVNKVGFFVSGEREQLGLEFLNRHGVSSDLGPIGVYIWITWPSNLVVPCVTLGLDVAIDFFGCSIGWKLMGCGQDF
jgi:hypothetical protein